MDDLSARLEGAAAGSRELEYDIKEWLEGFDDYWSLRVAADWTTSIDAAVALAERVLPGWSVEVAIINAGSSQCTANIWVPSQREALFGNGRVFVNAATPALALCAAVVRAHAEQVQG